MWRSLIGAPPLLIIELTEAEANSVLTGTAEGALTETAGESGTQSRKGGMQSMLTAMVQLSSPAMTDTSEEGVVYLEIDGGDGMCRESSGWALQRGALCEADERGLWGVEA